MGFKTIFKDKWVFWVVFFMVLGVFSFVSHLSCKKDRAVTRSFENQEPYINVYLKSQENQKDFT